MRSMLRSKEKRNGMRVLEWKWIGVSVIEVAERKNGMGMDA